MPMWSWLERQRPKTIKEPIEGDFFFSHPGHCVCCDHDVTFEAHDSWLRDHYICTNCRSIPRERALMTTIEEYFPNWRKLEIHESSPCDRGTSVKLKQYAKHYIPTQYYPGRKLGSIVDGFRNEDLERQTFKDASFDLVITQDVMEHIYDPTRAFREIARTLKKGGAHIFTVPIINKHKKTEVWAMIGKDSKPNFLHAPEWHGNPIDNAGSPVTMHWGFDIVDFIKEASRLDTEIIEIYDNDKGIVGEFREVLVSVKR